MRRTSRYIQVDCKEIFYSVAHLWVTPEQAAGYGAGAGGDDQLGLGDGLIGSQRGLLHVCGERTGNQDAVGMPRRCNEFDPEAARVEHDVAERIHLGFAAVAASRADLAQPQRPPQQPPQLPACRLDLHRAIAGYGCGS